MAQQTNIGFDLTQLDNIIKNLDRSLDNLLVKSNNATKNLSSQITSLAKNDLKQLGNELATFREKIPKDGFWEDYAASLRQYIALLEKTKKVEKTMRSAGVNSAYQHSLGVSIKEANQELSKYLAQKAKLERTFDSINKGSYIFKK